MEVVILAVVMLAGLGVFSVWYSTQMKKNYLHELEKELELQKFSLTGSMGGATVEATWKGSRIWIEALPSGPNLPSCIQYKMEHRSTFTAEIRPGAGLQEEISAKPEAREEETLRPWRAKLTEEEQALIAQRRGDLTAVDTGPKERFRVSSPKPNEVSQYLAQGSRNADIADAFKSGVSMVQVGFTDVVLVKSPYNANDMTPKVVENYLRLLKGLRVE